MKNSTLQGVKKLVAEMNLDCDGNGELVLREAQLFNRRHARLQFPLV